MLMCNCHTFLSIPLFGCCSGEEYRETRPLSLIASDEDGRIYSNLSCQTDPDPLDHDVRVSERPICATKHLLEQEYIFYDRRSGIQSHTDTTNEILC